MGQVADMICKLTPQDWTTYGGCKWVPGVTNTAPGDGPLCSKAWAHGYENPLVAVFMNPIHANIADPVLWECEGEIGIREGQLRCGCTSLTTLRIIPTPIMTIEQRVRGAIACSLVRYREASYVIWARGWLDGTDRSAAAVARAGGAARAAEAAWAGGAAWEAEAGLDLFAILEWAMTDSVELPDFTKIGERP